jgi:hypothetical protein
MAIHLWRWLLWQFHVQLVQYYSLFKFRLAVSANLKYSTIGRRYPHIYHHNCTELIKGISGCQAGCMTA